MPYYQNSWSWAIETPPNPAGYLDDFVATELARACVITKVYSLNQNQPPTGHNPMTEADERAVLGRGRDITGNNHYFWTVRIVMASKLDTNEKEFRKDEFTNGYFLPGDNTIFIFYERLNTLGFSDQNRDICIRMVLLHELGHALLIGTDAADHVSHSIMDGDVVLFGPNSQKFTNEHLKLIQQYSRANH